LQQIKSFIFRNKNLLLYLLLFVYSVVVVRYNHTRNSSINFFNSANWITGTGIINFKIILIGLIFNLEIENEKLVQENIRLKTVYFFNPRIQRKVTLSIL